MNCHKCNKEMTMTPVCVTCGSIPVAEGSFAVMEAELKRLKERDRVCPTMLESQARAYVRAFQEIANLTGMMEHASPRQIVDRVRVIVAERNNVLTKDSQ